MPASVTSLWQTIAQFGVALLVVIMALALLIVASAWRVLAALRRLRRAGKAGREASAGLPQNELPQTTFNRKGHPGDVINVEVVTTANQLAAAFTAAGWYRADEIDLVTSVRISWDSVLGRTYSTAPVSNLYLFGREEDFAFERPGRSVRERDHVRLWNTGREAQDGRPIWLGSATRDIKVVLFAKTNHLPTHKIAPDIDAERDLIAADLTATGFVIDQDWRPGIGKPFQGTNGTGDPYFTDGRVAVLVLANVFASPLATQVRGALGARLARGVARLLRWRLPRRGRERARRQRENRAE
jgi:LssY C-terminus